MRAEHEVFQVQLSDLKEWLIAWRPLLRRTTLVRVQLLDSV